MDDISKKSRIHFTEQNLKFIRKTMNRSGDNFTITVNEIIANARDDAHGVQNDGQLPK